MERRSKYVILACLILVLLGTTGIALRLQAMRAAPPTPGESQWRINYSIKFRTKGVGARCRVLIPVGTPEFRITRESLSHSELEVTVKQDQEGLEREILLVAPPQTSAVHFEAQLDVSARKISDLPAHPKELSAAGRNFYLQDEEGIPVTAEIVLKVLALLLEDDDPPEKILKRIFDYCSQIRDSKPSSKHGALPDAAVVLDQDRGTTLGKARAMVALCRAAGIPARIVMGFRLSEAPMPQPHFWVESHVAGRWVLSDPQFAVFQDAGASYLPLGWGQVGIVDALGAKKLSVRCTVKKLVPAALAPPEEYQVLRILDLTSLPPRLADAVTLMLLLPLGGLVISVFSNIFGLKSFGYFIPALIGLSFVGVKWLTGITVFAVFTCIGLGSRALIDKLALNKMPRLSLVLLTIVLSLTVTVSLLDYFDLKPSPRAVLLPMISLTMIIEQFHVRSEQQGYRSAFRKLGITLLVGSCCLFLFSIQAVQRLLLTFPESEFFIAATLVLVGRYKAESPPPLPQAQPNGPRPSELSNGKKSASNCA